VDKINATKYKKFFIDTVAEFSFDIITVIKKIAYTCIIFKFLFKFQMIVIMTLLYNLF